MVVIGLGNPGRRYDGTRHNAGFLVVDSLARSLGVRLSRVWLRGYLLGSTRGRLDQRHLAKPLTYMNRCGDILPDLLNRTSSGPEDILVVHDNVDLVPGTCRLKLRGSGGGGHRGIESIHRALGGGEFMRLAVGIGRPTDGRGLAEHVLDWPRQQEAAAFREGVERAARAVIELFEHGPEKVMNELNRRAGSTEN